MSKVFQKVRTGINLGQLTADPGDPQEGDFYYSTTTLSFRQYISGGWHNIVGDDLAQTLTNKQLNYSVTTDSTTTGSDATLQPFTTGVVILTNGSLVSVGGIPTGGSGQQVIIENKTGVTITIVNEDGSASAADRIQTGTGTNAIMSSNASFSFLYDTASSRWQLVGAAGGSSSVGPADAVQLSDGSGGFADSAKFNYVTSQDTLYVGTPGLSSPWATWQMVVNNPIPLAVVGGYTGADAGLLFVCSSSVANLQGVVGNGPANDFAMQTAGGRVGIGAGSITDLLTVNGSASIVGQIHNVTDPTSAQDAATKNYVDTHGGGANTSLSNISSTSLSADLNLNTHKIINTSQIIIGGSTPAANNPGLTVINSINNAAFFSTGLTSSDQGIAFFPQNGGPAYFQGLNGNFSASTDLAFQLSGNSVLIGTATNTGDKLNVNGSVNVAGQIHNVTDPTSAQDAATKNYVDTHGGSGITALTGDGTATGPGSVALTLATVNSNVGSFTNANITVNAKGLITAASNGTLGITRSVNSVSTATGAGSTAETDYVYLVTGTTTITLPTATGNSNLYTIKNVGTQVVTIATTSSQTIDGVTTTTIPIRYDSLDLISDGSNWNIV